MTLTADDRIVRRRSLGGTIMFSELSPFTKLHVVISLIGIVSGLVVMFGLLIGRKLNG